MKGFKKGIALIAVLAFLITAILPVSGLAASTNASDETLVETSSETARADVQGRAAATLVSPGRVIVARGASVTLTTESSAGVAADTANWDVTAVPSGSSLTVSTQAAADALGFTKGATSASLTLTVANDAPLGVYVVACDGTATSPPAVGAPPTAAAQILVVSNSAAGNPSSPTASGPQNIYGCANSYPANENYFVVDSQGWTKSPQAWNAPNAGLVVPDITPTKIYAWLNSSLIARVQAPAGTTPYDPGQDSLNYNTWGLYAGGNDALTQLNKFSTNSGLVPNGTTTASLYADNFGYDTVNSQFAVNDVNGQGHWYFAVRYTALSADPSVRVEWYWKVFEVIPVQAKLNVTLESTIAGSTGSVSSSDANARALTVPSNNNAWAESGVVAKANWDFYAVQCIPEDESNTGNTPPTAGEPVLASSPLTPGVDIVAGLEPPANPNPVSPSGIQLVAGEAATGNNYQYNKVWYNWSLSGLKAGLTGGSIAARAQGTNDDPGASWSVPIKDIDPGQTPCNVTCVATNVIDGAATGTPLAATDLAGITNAAGADVSGGLTTPPVVTTTGDMATVQLAVTPAMNLVASMNSLQPDHKNIVTGTPVSYMGVGGYPTVTDPNRNYQVFLTALMQPELASGDYSFVWSVDGPNLVNNANAKPTMKNFGYTTDTVTSGPEVALCPLGCLQEGSYTFTCIATRNGSVSQPSIAGSIQVRVAKGTIQIVPQSVAGYVDSTGASNLHFPDGTNGFTVGTTINGTFVPFGNGVGRWNATQAGTTTNANGVVGITSGNVSTNALIPSGAVGKIGEYALTFTLINAAGEEPLSNVSASATVTYEAPPANGVFYVQPTTANAVIGGAPVTFEGYVGDGTIKGGSPNSTTAWNLPTGPQETTWGDWNDQYQPQHIVNGQIRNQKLVLQPKAGIENGVYTFTANPAPGSTEAATFTVVVGPQAGSGTLSASASREGGIPLGLSDTITVTFTPDDARAVLEPGEVQIDSITDASGNDASACFAQSQPTAGESGSIVLTPLPGKAAAGQTYNVTLSAIGGEAANAGSVRVPVTVVAGTVTVEKSPASANYGFTRTFTAKVNGEPVATAAAANAVWYVYAPGGTTPSAASLGYLGITPNSSDSTGYQNPDGLAQIQVMPQNNVPKGEYTIRYALVESAGAQNTTLYGDGTLDVLGSIAPGTLFITPDEDDQIAGAEDVLKQFRALIASGNMNNGSPAAGGTWSLPVDENGSTHDLSWSDWGLPVGTTSCSGSTVSIRARETVPSGEYTLTYTTEDGKTATAIINVTNNTSAPSEGLAATAADPALVYSSNLAVDIDNATMGFEPPVITGDASALTAAPTLTVTAGEASWTVDNAYTLADGKLTANPVEITGEHITDVGSEGSISVAVNAPAGAEITGGPFEYTLNEMKFDFVWDSAASQRKARSEDEPVTGNHVAAGDAFSFSGTGSGLTLTVEGTPNDTVNGGVYVAEPLNGAPAIENAEIVVTDAEEAGRQRLTFSGTMPADAATGTYEYKIGLKLRPNASFSIEVTTITIDVTGSDEPAPSEGDFQIQNNEYQQVNDLTLTVGQEYGLFAMIYADVDGTLEWIDATAEDGSWASSDTSVVELAEADYENGINLVGLKNGKAEVTYTVAETGEVLTVSVTVGDGTVEPPTPEEEFVPDPFESWTGFDAYSPEGGPADDVQVAEQWAGPATLTLKDGSWDDADLPQGVTVSTDGKTLTVMPTAFSGPAPQSVEVTYTDASGTHTVTIWKGQKTTLAGNVSITADHPFTYWTQPVSGLFGRDENTSVTLDQMVPVDTVNGHYKIGPDQAYVRPASDAAEGTYNALEVNERVQIYLNPANILVGETSLDYNNWQDSVTMQWQYKPSQSGEDDGNAREIPAGLGFSGVRSPLLTISPLTAAMDGWQVRLVIWKDNQQDYVASPWIELDIDGVDASVIPEVTITSYPEASGSNVNVPATADVTLTASVQSYLAGNPIRYQWFSMAPVTAENPNPEWAAISGETSNTLTIPAVTETMSGTSYRCQAVNETGSVGVVGTSNTLKLNVLAPDGSVIISEPTAEVLYQFVEGRTLTTSVTARTDNGDPVSYGWYVKSYQGPIPTGDNAIDTIAEAAAYTAAGAFVPVEGATGPSMTSAPLTEGVYVFRCRVQNAENDAKAEFSQPVYVVVSSLGAIKVSPAANETTSVGVLNGKAVTLAPVISGPTTGLRYNWQISENGGVTWADLTATTPSLTLPNLTTTSTNSRYRLVITSGNATVTSGNYLLNVWDTANTPVIRNSPLSQSTTYAALSTGTAQINTLSSTATVSQANDVRYPVSVQWYKNTAEGPRMIAEIACTPETASRTAAAPTEWTYVAEGKQVKGTVTISQDASTPNRYTSTIRFAYNGVPGKEWAEAVNGTYYCVWYKQQTENEVCAQTQAKNQPKLLAPQAASDTAEISISVAGNPRITAQNDCPVSVSVGESASFWVSAVLNQDPSFKDLPTYLVYTWQKSTNYDPSDHSGAWSNILTTDGTGQFTQRYTTPVITQQQYDENYNPWFRVIIANRATGTKVVSDPCHLVISDQPAGTPELPSNGSITVEGTAPNRYATGVTVSVDGTTVDQFLDDYGYNAPAGYTLQIVGSDGTVLAGDALVYTGCVLRLMNDADNTVADSATIIVKGDVLGASNTGKVGTLAINQLVRMAQDLNETRPLDGIYEMAGDFNDNGSIDIADLVAEAQLLSLDEPVQK